ncbi:MAG: SDR family NAD(P)-dependent oxidoreductase [Myxococcota bacterium]
MIELAVAVVGMACRVPGADGVEPLLALVRGGREALTRFGPDEGRRVRVRGVLAGVEDFDPDGFGLSRREAAALDPQHRLALALCREALERAGHAGPDLRGSDTGVFLSANLSTYLLRHLLPAEAQLRALGPALLQQASCSDTLAPRVAWRFGLRGPALAVQTACSSSLVAVHLAVQALLTGECGMALAGGVSVVLPADAGYDAVEGGLCSPTGRVRTFDADADGTVFSDGAGVVVLRRLEDALADGDTVHGVILGSAVNSDGDARVGFTAPSVDGQAAVVRAAHAVAGIAPSAVGYVECHGTGTPMGDPIEVQALRTVFDADADVVAGQCRLGALKPNLGHLDNAAGVVGLIAAVGAVRDGIVPGTLHLARPNPALPLAGGPFALSAETGAWAGPEPRVAGVSAFGIGGTNAHVVVAAPPAQAASAGAGPRLLVASAPSAEQLDAWLAAAAPAVGGRRCPTSRGRWRWGARTRPRGGTWWPTRWRTPRGSPSRRRRAPKRRRRSCSRSRARGWSTRAWASRSPAPCPRPTRRCGGAPRSRRRCSGATCGRPSPIPRPCATRPWATRRCLPRRGPRGGRSPRTGSRRPPWWATRSASTWRPRWPGCGRPRTPCGWSSRGEAARGAAGGRDAGGGAGRRGAGGDAAAGLRGGGGQRAERRRGVGARGGHRRAGAAPRRRGAPAPRAPGAPQRRGAPRGRRARGGGGGGGGVGADLRVATAVTGGWAAPGALADPAHWGAHLRQPVRVAEAVRAVGALPRALLLDVGPGTALASLAAAIPGAPPAIACQPHPRGPEGGEHALLGALGQLWQRGVDVDLGRACPGGRRIELPPTPLRLERCWIEPGEVPAAGGPALVAPAWVRAPRAPDDDVRASWLVYTAGGALGREVVRRLQARGATVTVASPGERFERRDRGLYALRPGEDADHAALLAELRSAAVTPSRIVHLYGAEDVPADADDVVPLLEPAALCRALVATGRAADVAVTFAARGVWDVRGDEALAPAQALLVGVARVAPQEHRELGCRLVDVADADPDALLREAAHPGDGWAVALRGARRWVPRYEPVAPAAPATGTGGVLVTGGSGGVGGALAAALAARGHGTVVLLSRRAAAPGAGVHVRGDARDRGDLERALALAAADPAGLAGVVHAAGLPGSGPLAAWTPEAARAVVAPKREGAEHLVALLAGRGAWLLLCGSVASHLGGPGQADYAAANAALDAIARAARARGVAAVSVGSDTWQQVGMAARAEVPNAWRPLHEARLAEGWRPDAGAQAVLGALDAGLAGELPEVLASAVPWAERLRAATPAAVAAAIASSRPADAVAADFVPPASDVEQAVAEVFAEVLGVPRIGARDDFFALGGHSLLAAQAVARLRELFDVDLPVMVLFEGRRVDAVAASIEDALLDDPELLL